MCTVFRWCCEALRLPAACWCLPPRHNYCSVNTFLLGTVTHLSRRPLGRACWMVCSTSPPWSKTPLNRRTGSCGWRWVQKYSYHALITNETLRYSNQFSFCGPTGKEHWGTQAEEPGLSPGADGEWPGCWRHGQHHHRCAILTPEFITAFSPWDGPPCNALGTPQNILATAYHLVKNA